MIQEKKDFQVARRATFFKPVGKQRINQHEFHGTKNVKKPGQVSSEWITEKIGNRMDFLYYITFKLTLQGEFLSRPG